MADINIERKGSSVWPWIIGLLLLAVVVWVVLQYFQGREDTVGVPADSTGIVQPAPQYAPAPAPAVIDSGAPAADTTPDTATSSL